MPLIFNGTTGFRDTGTGALGLPSGTTAQRPANPANGFIRYNTDLGIVEAYVNGSWGSYNLSNYTAEMLMVAGGGGGSQVSGGGAGGLIYTTSLALQGGTNYTVTIGAGGSPGVNGGNTIFTTFTAVGGGSAANGGSGGGGQTAGNGVPGPQYSGTAGQGTSGGRAIYVDNNGDWFASGGGGGGAGQAGGWYGWYDASGGKGGDGLQYNITGTNTFYAGGGGGGGGRRQSGGAGGLGGGGSGAASSGVATGGNGGVNLGGGGGGGGWNGTPGFGGSGVLIIRYLGNQRGVGGIVTSSGGYTIHTFNSSANYLA